MLLHSVYEADLPGYDIDAAWLVLQVDRPELYAECGAGEVILPALILQLIQLLVIRTALQKGLMRSHVNDTAFVHHDNLVGIENGGEAVGDGNDSLAFRQLMERILNRTLGFGVEC